MKGLGERHTDTDLFVGSKLTSGTSSTIFGSFDTTGKSCEGSSEKDHCQAGDTVIFTDSSLVHGSKTGWAFTTRVDGVVVAEEFDATDLTLSSMQTEINAVTLALSWVKQQNFFKIE